MSELTITIKTTDESKVEFSRDPLAGYFDPDWQHIEDFEADHDSHFLAYGDGESFSGCVFLCRKTPGGRYLTAFSNKYAKPRYASYLLPKLRMSVPKP
jgi:hypothetical protein